MIAASNLLEKLDPALLRPGRFDRQILVTAPDLKGRRAILDVHTRNKPLEPSIDLGLIARQTSNLTGADLANICNEAAIFAGRDHRTTIGTKDFQAALERVIAGMQSRRVITEHEKRVVAYHEAGHALCSELLPSVEKVHRISIIPRGRALGYTLNLPEEDRYLKTKDELLDYMVVLLGGRVTEHIVFGTITTGASDDLRKVHDISRGMITQYGMGTELKSKQLPSDDYSMSDHTRRMIDEEQQYLTDLAHRRAMKLVAENRTLLEAFAFTLLENEVLEREDIDAARVRLPGRVRRTAGALRTGDARARSGARGRLRATRRTAAGRIRTARVPDPPASIALIVNPASGAGSNPDVIAGLLREYGVEVTPFSPDERRRRPRREPTGSRWRAATAHSDRRRRPRARGRAAGRDTGRHRERLRARPGAAGRAPLRRAPGGARGGAPRARPGLDRRAALPQRRQRRPRVTGGRGGERHEARCWGRSPISWARSGRASAGARSPAP